MEADFSIELGAEDETLEFPWTGPEGGPRYCDLKQQPELLPAIEEARHLPELGAFLAAINSRASTLETAKCDTWFTREINAEEEIFGASGKFGSYVDFLYSSEELRYSFPRHEQLAARLAQLLKGVPEIPAAAEFLVRRCYYHTANGVRDGFYITFYLFGYGDDESHARRQWGIGLKFVGDALRQLSAQ